MSYNLTPTHDSFRARMERLAHPHTSWCGRCGRPWGKVKGHSTWYTENRACFPLCEECWTTLGSPEARIPYYAALIQAWESDSITPEDRMALGRAVANGG